MTKPILFQLASLLLALLPPLAAAAQAPGWAWVKTHTSTGYPVLGENRAAGVGRDAAGNIYTAGSYTDIPTFGGQATTNLGGSEVFLAKYNPDGNLLWLKALHGAAADVATTLAVLPSGRCLVGGYFGAGPGGGNLSFAEFGSSLVLPGAQQLGLAPATLVGPTGQPVYHSTPFLMAVEPDGTLAWAIDPSPTNRVEPKELACDPQGNIYLSATSYYGLSLNGTAYPAIGNSDAVLLKYNASGQLQWVRRVGRANQAIGSEAVKVDNSGSAYLMVGHSAGFTLGTLNVPYGGGSTLVKVSPTNQVKWAKNSLILLNGQPVYLTMPGFDPAGALYLALSSPNSGNLTFSGPGSPLNPPNSNPNIYTSYVIKCDTAAQVSWVKPVAGAIAATGTYSGVYDIQRLCPSTNGFTALTYTVASGQSTFVGSPVTYGAADGGLVCVLRYNTSTDQVEWVRTGGTAYGASSSNSRSGTNVRGAVLDPTGNVYIAGEYYGPAQFGAVNLGLTGGQRSSYLAKLDQTVLPTKAAVAGKSWRVYPNPASSMVQLEGLPARATVRVLDALGREVRSTQAATLDLSGLAPGLYLLQAVGTAEPYQPQRLLVE